MKQTSISFSKKKASRIIAFVLSAAMVFTMLPIPPFTAAAAGGPYTVTVEGGKHGQVSYNGQTSDSMEFTVNSGEKLPEGIEIVPEVGYRAEQFDTGSGKTVKQVSFGYDTTYLIMSDGSAWAAGMNHMSQLSSGITAESVHRFVPMIQSDGSPATNVKKIVGGLYFTIVLKNDGTVWTCGSTASGQIGQGMSGQEDMKVDKLTKVQDLSGITDIAAGYSSSYAVKNDGTLWVAGGNDKGQLGLDQGTTFVTNRFVQCTGISDVSAVSADSFGKHVMALKNNGTVWSCGYGFYGQLGIKANDGLDRKTFQQMKKDDGSEILASQISAGQNHSVVIQRFTGNVYTCGDNSEGQLGNGKKGPDLTEVRYGFIQALQYIKEGNNPIKYDPMKADSIAAGGNQTVALQSGGRVWATGDVEGAGQMNDYRTLYFDQCKDYYEKGYLTDIVSIAAGSRMIGAVSSSWNGGYAKFAGHNINGQFGNGESGATARNIIFTTSLGAYGEKSLSDITVTRDMTIKPVYMKTPIITLTADPATPPTQAPFNVTFQVTLTNVDPDINIGAVLDLYDGNTKVGSFDQTLVDPSAGTKTILPITLKGLSRGTHHFKATLPDSTHQTAGESNVLVYEIAKSDQSALSLGTLPTEKIYGDAPFIVRATGGSGSGAISYQSSDENVATINPSTGEVTIVGVGSFTITATKAGTDDYKQASVTGNAITVSPKSLSITGLTPTDREYDGTTDVALTGGVLSGVVNSDDVTVTIPTSGTIQDANWGQNKLVSVAKPTLSGTKSSNYVLADLNNVYVNIAKKAVTITGVTVSDKVYDGTTKATIQSQGTLNGKIEGDSLTISSASATCTFNSANAGRDIPITANGFSLGGASASNYILTAQPTVANASITKAPLNVSVEKVIIKSGQAIPALNVQVSGFVNGETESISDFSKPTATVDGTVDTTDTSLTSFNVLYSGGNATGNYEFKYTNTAEIQIAGVEIQDGDYEASADLTQWQNSDLTITPQKDYTQISTDGSTWKSTLTLSAEGEQTVTIYLKKADGTTSAGKDISYKLDKTKPEVEITIKENTFKSIINTISFGIFCKDNMDVSISVSDSLSQIANGSTQYMLCEDKDTTGHTYQSYTQKVSISKDGTYVVYAKVKDNAGNETIVHSDGAVVYTDSTAKTTSVSYEKLSNQDQTVEVNLNGNTIAKITMNNTNLVKDSDYMINNGVITLKGTYLESLAKGNYTYTVSYNPLGEEYDPTNADGNITYQGDAPATTSFSVSVGLKALTVNNFTYTAPKKLTYDGTEKIAAVDKKSGVTGLGEITVKYYNGSILLKSAPINVGTYTVKIDVAEGANYSKVSDLQMGTFTIINANQDIPTTPTPVDTTTLANNDGKITGVTSDMEYQKQGDSNWTTCPDGQITGLAEGTYYVRYAAKPNYNASESKTLTISKFNGTQETKPNASFDAIDRILSSTVIGQKYRIDSGDWVEITSDSVDLSAIIIKACTIEVFMPGDGIHTLDSDIQTINVAKAATPNPTATNETIDGKNDGIIAGVNTTMEYKTETGTWTKIIGETIPNLSDGQYFVRVKATQDVLESDGVALTITAGRMLNVTYPTGEGYTLSNTTDESVSYNGTFSFKLTVSDGYNSDNMVVQANEDVLTSTDGVYTVSNITEDTNITITGIADILAPTAEIALGENKWNSFLNTVTFGLFFKDTQTVTVTAKDENGSGIKSVEYLLSQAAFESENDIIGKWTELTLNNDQASFSVAPNSKQFVYLKVTDQSGNYNIINSDGIVVYTDSELVTKTAEFNHDQPKDIVIQLKSNDNDLKAIKNGNQVLVKDTDYTVDHGEVIIKQSYLAKNLTEDSLDLTFEWNPMGEEFNGTESTPANATFTVTKHAHNWDHGIITTPATIHQDGVKTYTCTTCYFTKTEVIAKLPSSDKVLGDHTNGVSIGGVVTDGAKLTVDPISSGNTFDSLIKLIDTQKNQVIGIYEISITNGEYAGELTLTFNVGKKLDGKTLTVYHQKASGEVEILTTVCKDGLAVITVTELSPFMVTVAKDIPENPSNSEAPSTGDHANALPWIALLLLSSAVIAAIAATRKKTCNK